MHPDDRERLRQLHEGELNRYLVVGTLFQVDAATEDEAVQQTWRYLESHGIVLDDAVPDDQYVVWVNRPEDAEADPDLVPDYAQWIAHRREE